MPAFAAADCIEEVIVEKVEGEGSGLAGLRERRLFLLLRADAEFAVVHAEVTELLSNVIRGHTEETRNF